MKYLLIPLALVAGSAFACPGEGSKDTMAPASAKPAVAAKAQPKQQVAATKTEAKVAAKAAPAPRKLAGL